MLYILLLTINKIFIPSSQLIKKLKRRLEINEVYLIMNKEIKSKLKKSIFRGFKLNLHHKL